MKMASSYRRVLRYVRCLPWRFKGTIRWAVAHSFRHASPTLNHEQQAIRLISLFEQGFQGVERKFLHNYARLYHEHATISKLHQKLIDQERSFYNSTDNILKVASTTTQLAIPLLEQRYKAQLDAYLRVHQISHDNTEDNDELIDKTNAPKKNFV